MIQTEIDVSAEQQHLACVCVCVCTSLHKTNFRCQLHEPVALFIILQKMISSVFQCGIIILFMASVKCGEYTDPAHNVARTMT